MENCGTDVSTTFNKNEDLIPWIREQRNLKCCLGIFPDIYGYVRKQHFKIEEVPQNMYCILSDEENIIMEMQQKIQIYTCSAALDHDGISIITFSFAPALESIFFGTW